MQSTGHTSIQASQPVQLSARMTASSLGSFLRGLPAALAMVGPQLLMPAVEPSGVKVGCRYVCRINHFGEKDQIGPAHPRTAIAQVLATGGRGAGSRSAAAGRARALGRA